MRFVNADSSQESSDCEGFEHSDAEANRKRVGMFIADHLSSSARMQWMDYGKIVCQCGIGVCTCRDDHSGRVSLAAELDSFNDAFLHSSRPLPAQVTACLQNKWC